MLTTVKGIVASIHSILTCKLSGLELVFTLGATPTVFVFKLMKRYSTR